MELISLWIIRPHLLRMREITPDVAAQPALSRSIMHIQASRATRGAFDSSVRRACRCPLNSNRRRATSLVGFFAFVAVQFQRGEPLQRLQPSLSLMPPLHTAAKRDVGHMQQARLADIRAKRDRPLFVLLI